MPSMKQMKQDHLGYEHHGQVATIASELRNRFSALQVICPEEADTGRYIAVYVMLVSGLARMRVHFTSSGLNQHSHILQPITGPLADRRRFVAYLKHHHPSISLKEAGHYAKLPGSARPNVKNDNNATIALQLHDALKVFIGAPSNGAGQ